MPDIANRPTSWWSARIPMAAVGRLPIGGQCSVRSADCGVCSAERRSRRRSSTMSEIMRPCSRKPARLKLLLRAQDRASRREGLPHEDAGKGRRVRCDPRKCRDVGPIGGGRGELPGLRNAIDVPPQPIRPQAFGFAGQRQHRQAATVGSTVPVYATRLAQDARSASRCRRLAGDMAAEWVVATR